MSILDAPRCYPSAREGVKQAAACALLPQTQSDSYRLAFADPQFLLRNELRPLRLQLELLKPELILQEHDIEATIVVFGGARIVERHEAERRLRHAEQEAARQPDDPEAVLRAAQAARILAKSKYYEEARALGRIVSEACLLGVACKLVVMTGGGPGIMEAANRGAAEAGSKSIGLNIVLPHEQAPNPYITSELCFQFHYFAIRKMHFLMRARSLVVFPGGFGTFDELFETLTLIQTKKIKPLPVLLFGKKFWSQAVDFDFLVGEGVIAPEDLGLFHYVETAAEAWKIIADFYNGKGSEKFPEERRENTD